MLKQVLPLFDQNAKIKKQAYAIIDNIPPIVYFLYDLILKNVDIGNVHENFLQKTFILLPFPAEVTENEGILNLLVSLAKNKRFAMIHSEIALVFIKLLLLREEDRNEFHLTKTLISEMKTTLKNLSKQDPNLKDALNEQFPSNLFSSQIESLL